MNIYFSKDRNWDHPNDIGLLQNPTKSIPSMHLPIRLKYGEQTTRTTPAWFFSFPQWKNRNVGATIYILHQYYCSWKKSCTTWNVWNPANNGIKYQPQLVIARFLTSTEAMAMIPTFSIPTVQVIKEMTTRLQNVLFYQTCQCRSISNQQSTSKVKLEHWLLTLV